MPWFRCFIRGENFALRIDDELGRYGFFVTRFVEAVDERNAELTALRRQKAEPMLSPPAGHVPTGQAKVSFVEIERVPADQVLAVAMGFACFPMESEDV